MTRSEIRSISRSAISQSDTGNTDYTDSELNTFIDMGIRWLATLVQWPRDKGEWTSQVGVGAYTLPSDFIAPLYVDFGNPSVERDMKPLDLVTEAELREAYPDWQDETDGTRGRPRKAMKLDQNTLYIHPRPDADNASKRIIMGYVYSPAILGGDGESPDLPINYHDLIPDYVKWECFKGRLKREAEAPAILSSLVERAKLIEPVVTKEQELQRMFWGSADGFDSDDSEIRFA